jgi:hypothetical protein
LKSARAACFNGSISSNKDIQRQPFYRWPRQNTLEFRGGADAGGLASAGARTVINRSWVKETGLAPAGPTGIPGPRCPKPNTPLVDEPPLLVKTTALLKLPELVGVKATATVLVEPAAMLKVPPLLTENGPDGAGTVAAPVKTWPPKFAT